MLGQLGRIPCAMPARRHRASRPTSPQGPLRIGKSPTSRDVGLFEISSGGVLLSHTDDRAVPSALEDLTSEFGMGSGVTPPVLPPEKLKTRISNLVSFRSIPICESTSGFHLELWVDGSFDLSSSAECGRQGIERRLRKPSVFRIVIAKRGQALAPNPGLHPAGKKPCGEN